MNVIRAQAALMFLGVFCCAGPVAKAKGRGSKEATLDFQGAKRKYFVSLPKDFSPDKACWLLVAVHGGGGRPQTNSNIIALRRMAADSRLPSIVIAPEFNTEDKQVSRFPALGEGAFLKAVLKNVRTKYKTHPKILLTGYSMGGQFTHRFALANPELVLACAPFAAGTWTTPGGTLLIEEHGEVVKPKAFLSSKENAKKVPKRLRNLFDARTAEVAGLPAKKGAEKVPFLVMCGTLDPRLSIAKSFASHLKKAGFVVETEWPETPHSAGSQKQRVEFEKFPKHAVAFFQKHIGSK